ncbi:MAG: hypothetical protein KQH63_13470 [Desulfobulbaceae bacterium]|nr:hypothetical protein [Desulfobulbaceae bacterium]
MKKIIADTIIIRVGQGIMAIPRKINAGKKSESCSIDMDDCKVSAGNTAKRRRATNIPLASETDLSSEKKEMRHSETH